MPFPFLSPEWIAAMREIRADFADHERSVPVDLAANVTVTDPPFGSGAILGHIDTTGPALTIDEGHLDTSDFGIELPYELARRMFVDRDPTQVMPALMGGAIKLTGDSSKVLGLAALVAPSGAGSETARALDGEVPVDVLRELAARIDAITER